MEPVRPRTNIFLSLPRRGRVAVRRTDGWGRLQCHVDRCEHAFNIAVDVVVPEAQHFESVAFETLVAQSIAPRVLFEIMLAAVNLNDEAMPQADEVHNRTA